MGGDTYSDFSTCKSENTEILDIAAFDVFVMEELNGVVDERYAKPAGHIHIIEDESAEGNSDAAPAASSAASPVSMLAVFAGLAAGVVFTGMRR